MIVKNVITIIFVVITGAVFVRGAVAAVSLLCRRKLLIFQQIYCDTGNNYIVIIVN